MVLIFPSQIVIRAASSVRRVFFLEELVKRYCRGETAKMHTSIGVFQNLGY